MTHLRRLTYCNDCIFERSIPQHSKTFEGDKKGVARSTGHCVLDGFKDVVHNRRSGYRDPQKTHQRVGQLHVDVEDGD
jgi:hypothetical protein